MLLWTATGAQAQEPRPGGGGDSTLTQVLNSPTDAFELLPGYPNPFNPTLQIRFALQAPAPVQLDIYNLLGQRVQTLIARRLDAGVHEVRWNAREGRGAELPSGVYLIRLGVGAAMQTQTVVLQR